MRFISVTIIFLSLTVAGFGLSASFEDETLAARVCYAALDFDNAISHYCEALKIAPEASKARILSNIGQCYRSKKDFDRALTLFDEALDFDPSYEKALYWSVKLRLPHVYESHDVARKVELLLQRALEKYPQKPHVRQLYAEFEMSKNGDCRVPGVEYQPNFLSDRESRALQTIFERAKWDRKKKKNSIATLSQFRDNDKSMLELLLAPIFDRLKDYDVIPSGVDELGWVVLQYAPEAFLKLHKDHAKRVDHFVLGISIGASCHLDLQLDKSGEKTFVSLASKSLYVTGPEAHDSCKHGISDVENTRYCVLFYVPSPQDDYHDRYDIKGKKFISHCNCCQDSSDFFDLLILLKLLSSVGVAD